MNSPLLVPPSLLDAMMSHAAADAPREACGVLPAPQGSDIPTRWVPMLNAALGEDVVLTPPTDEFGALLTRAPAACHRFEFDPQQQLSVWQEMAARQEWPAVIYHSHTITGHHPSDQDVESMRLQGGSHWVILSMRDLTLMSYRWDESVGVVAAPVHPTQPVDTGLDTPRVVW